MNNVAVKPITAFTHITIVGYGYSSSAIIGAATAPNLAMKFVIP